jgi:hypothetical protein
MIFPLAFHLNYVILFSSVFSVLLIIYARNLNNRVVLSSSLVLITIMMLMFIYKFAFFYFPGFYSGAVPLNRNLFADGFLSEIFILPAILIHYRIIKTSEMPLPGKWFSRRSYRRFLKILFLTMLYLSAFWCWNFLFTLVFPFEEAKVLSCFSFTCLYLIILIPILAKQKSSLLNPVLLLAALTLATYPLLVNQAIVSLRDIGLQHGGVCTACFIVHFMILPLIVALMASIFNYFMKRREKKRILIHGMQVLAILYGFSVLLIEYDHLTVFFGYNGQQLISEIVSTNHRLPWSIILLIGSILLIGYSLIKRHRFIRQVSYLLIITTLAKILVFDFFSLGTTVRVVLLFLLGSFLISFSLLYQRFRKAVGKNRDAKSPSPGA